MHNRFATHEEKQIAIARINAKLRLRDNDISELQEIRDKYDKMMREVFQQPYEPVTSPVGRPVGIFPAGIQIPVGINKLKKPPNSSDLDLPASDSGPSEGRRKMGRPSWRTRPRPSRSTRKSSGQKHRFQEIQSQYVTSLSLPCHLRQDFHLWRSSVRDAVTALYEYDPDAAHTWITAVEKPTATFDLTSMYEPHFAAVIAELVEAINTFLNSRNDDLARQLTNVKETAVKKEPGRLKGRQLLWTVYEYYKVDPKSAVLFKMI